MGSLAVDSLAEPSDDVVLGSVDRRLHSRLDAEQEPVGSEVDFVPEESARERFDWAASGPVARSWPCFAVAQDGFAMVLDRRALAGIFDGLVDELGTQQPSTAPSGIVVVPESTADADILSLPVHAPL